MEENKNNEEFIWEEEKSFGEDYSQEERAKMEEIYAKTLNEITEKEVVKGTIVGINDRDIILNIGFKSDGLVSATEFRDMPELKVGDEVEVFIEKQEDANGQLILSRRKAKIVKAWEYIQNAQDKDEIIDGFVKRRTKGGLIVDIFGIEAFLPGSQIDVKPIRDFDIFVGKKMEVKVVKINYTNDNVVVSHKVLIEKDLEKQKAEILENLEKGQVLEGVIKNMTNFGVFIDLGGVDGLLHITDISWGRINHPEEILNLDEKVNVVVLDFDDDKKRISLGMKQLTAHPWDSLPEDIELGSKVKGKIVNVADYGAFLEILPGVEGLIHVSEMSWSQHLRNPQDFIEIGDELEAVVLTLDREDRKMSLGIKQLSEDPWTKQDVLTKYAVGTKHKGIIRNLTNFGLFIELEEGIDGLVHVSDLSWTKKIKHPSEFVKVSDELEVQVLELDVENRRLALGHKQLEENPWDTFETVFVRGSIHKCTVISKNDKGAVLELPYGIEGFATAKNLMKEDGSSSAVGETLDFRVLEFSKDDKRIVLSHTATYQDRDERPFRKQKPRKSGVSKVNAGVEKDTLGDFEALTELREKMAGGGKKVVAKPVEKADKTAAKEVKPETEEPEVKETGAEMPKEETKAAAEVKGADSEIALTKEDTKAEVKKAGAKEEEKVAGKEEEKVTAKAEEKVTVKAEEKAGTKEEKKAAEKPKAKATPEADEEVEKIGEVKKPARKAAPKKATVKKEKPKADTEVKETKAVPKQKSVARPKAATKKAASKKEDKAGDEKSK
jgi:small subunit ribosomal protein S1